MYRRMRLLPLLTLLAAGCAPLMYRGAPAVDDPYWLSPRAQSLDAPSTRLGESTEIPDITTNRPTPDGFEPLPNLPEEAGPELGEGVPSVPDAEEGPSIGPVPGNVPPQIELDVDVPEQCQLDGRVTFLVTVSNEGDRPADDVVVVCQLDEGMSLPGRDDQAVRNELDRLGPGERKEMRLTVSADDVGRRCCRFDVTVDGREAVWKQVCVEVVPRSLSLEVFGPRRRTVGSRAEYVVSVRNVTTEPVENVELEVGHGATLEAKEGSSGAKRAPGQLTWQLDTVAPGETVQVQIEFACRTASSETCLSTRVSAADVPDDDRETCLTIEKPQGPFVVTIADDIDPVSVGDDVRIVVGVENRGLDAVSNVVTRVAIPNELRVANAKANRDGQGIDLGFDVRDERVEFLPVKSLASGAKLEYTLQVKALRAGSLRVPASILAEGVTTVKTSETLVVNPAPAMP